MTINCQTRQQYKYQFLTWLNPWRTFFSRLTTELIPPHPRSSLSMLVNTHTCNNIISINFSLNFSVESRSTFSIILRHITLSHPSKLVLWWTSVQSTLGVRKNKTIPIYSPQLVQISQTKKKLPPHHSPTPLPHSPFHITTQAATTAYSFHSNSSSIELIGE